MSKVPARIERAFQTISEACGELSTLRRRGNFFSSTLARLDGEDGNVCEALGLIRGFAEDLAAENAELQKHTLANVSGEDAEELPIEGEPALRDDLNYLASHEGMSFEELYELAMNQRDPGAWIEERGNENDLDGAELHRQFDAEMDRRGDAAPVIFDDEPATEMVE